MSDTSLDRMPHRDADDRPGDTDGHQHRAGLHHELEARAQRVAACALGLAYAGRDDERCLTELVEMAIGQPAALDRAAAQLPADGVDQPIADRARALLERASPLVREPQDG